MNSQSCGNSTNLSIPKFNLIVRPNLNIWSLKHKQTAYDVNYKSSEQDNPASIYKITIFEKLYTRRQKFPPEIHVNKHINMYKERDRERPWLSGFEEEEEEEPIARETVDGNL